ncbi:MAG: alpha/beta hydrolase [Nocardioides sp.]
MQTRLSYNVVESGRAEGPVMLFAHGFGCDQHMWRFVAPAFEDRFRVICFDHVGAGGAQATYDPERHARLEGYAEDVLRICRDLDLSDVTFVGHSVSAMIGMLAHLEDPSRFSALVMVGPSPRYINDTSYVGGFGLEDIEAMLESLASNYVGWSHAMAPAIVGNPSRPELGEELATSFCRSDPDIAERFARATFLSDNRDDLAHVSVPTLVLQCSDDIIAPVEVGEFVAREIPDSELVVLQATGHCPNLSAPAEVVEAINDFVDRRG